jgi:hypothetical protein
MALAKNIGKKTIFFNLHGGGQLSPSCLTYFNILNQSWVSQIALRGVFLLVFLLFFLGGSLIICDEPWDEKLTPPM